MISKEHLQEYQQLDIVNGVLPVSQKSKNRLYLCWRNAHQVQCKMIGPQTKCFCNHRFKEHQYLNPQGKKPYCKAPKCKCKCYQYIPVSGANDFKCLCKHSFKQHDLGTKKCTRDKDKCNNCHGFASAWTCSCGSKYGQHITIIQTYEQRKSKGKAINDMVRLNNELNSAVDEGSLYKPTNNIKQDPQARVKMKRQSLGLKMGYQDVKKVQTRYQQEEQIEEYHLDSRKQKNGNKNLKR